MHLHAPGVTGLTKARAILAAMPMPMPMPLPTARAPATAARLFVALWPGPAVRRALAGCRDRQAWPAGARPTADRQLHLTLHFIGAVPAGRVGEVAAALAVPSAAFELTLDRIEAWPRGLVVCCPAAIPTAMQHLHAELAGALRQLALPVEPRPFRPHVTLARRASPCPPLTQPGPLRWPVHDHVLVQSIAGAPYRVLRRYR